MELICPVARFAQKAPDRPAVVFGEQTLTYAQLDRQARALQAALQKRGVGPGDRIAVLAENSLALVALIHAAGRLQATLVFLNARLTAAELAPLAARAKARLALADPGLGEKLPGSERLAELAAEGDSAEGAQLDPASVRVVLFTSGTEGVPKGAQLTAAALQASARASLRALHGSEESRWVSGLPLFHVGGLMVILRCAEAGACVVLQERFDAAATARALLAGASHVSLVATTLSRTLDALERALPPGPLRLAFVGGGPVPAELLARARAMNLPALQTYGLTEVCSSATCERLDDCDGTTAGWPMEGTEVRVVDGSLAPLPPGEVGAVQLRGPTVMAGYLDDPEATARAFDPPGAGPRTVRWLRTGDLGSLDARGRLTIHSRRADLIVSGGENVYPAEVEAAILTHPDVIEAAVLARPDARWGQVGLVAVAARRTLSLEELQGFLRQRLASFKIPKQLSQVAALPRTPLGKLDRSALRKQLALDATSD